MTTGYSGRRVLVTGAGGFIGSHLVEALAREGAEVRALVRYTSTGSAGWLDARDPGAAISIVRGDIRDRPCVENAMRDCSIVFHLAALISIPYSYEAPQSYVDVNVGGTLAVLESARRLRGIRVVQTSTSEVYGTPESVPITESHALRPQSPYAASKVGADALCDAFARSFDVPVVILRPFNTYGPRQSRRAVLPTILTQLLAGAPEIRLGSTWPRRDLTYVADTVSGFLAAGLKDAALGQTIQLGTGEDISVGDLAALAQSVLGKPATIVADQLRVRPEASEVACLVSRPDRAKALLGWTPLVGLQEGIRQTAAWLSREPAVRAHDYAI
jgi:NAD dependent epimerase/dehydratase